jgi:glycyl-tRNA synthetase beta chain
LSDFIYERLAGSLREQGYSALEVDAVVGLRPARLGDIPKRLAAVRAFAALPEAASLAAANKRVGNILKKAEGRWREGRPGAAQGSRRVGAEPGRSAWSSHKADAAFERGDYTGLAAGAGRAERRRSTTSSMRHGECRGRRLRANRLGLLATLHQAMNRVADLSRLSA